MCGLTGFFTRRLSSESALSDQLQRMNSTLHHRGPDSEGIWMDAARGIALAHRRLAILDLSPLGHQPMISRDERYVIVFNGEIYNFADIRQQLEKLGTTFRGHSDTEIMLEAFSTWGVTAALQKFDGMFAFALWDRRTMNLTLARDRIGEKPLYYGWQGDTFLFGSELKALRQHEDWRNQINRDALSLLLRHNFIPAPYSIFTDIYKLEPGSFLVLDGNSGHVSTGTYWSFREVFEAGIARPFAGTADELVDELEAELRTAIQKQMIADVPLGAFLSGGTDSSTIVALMQSIGTSPVKTFTIGFGEDRYNEAHFARAISAHLHTDHTELYVTSAGAREVVPLLPQIYDEPFADSSQIPTFLVSRLAREKVTVSLSGDAGDELFGGYQRYFQMQRYRQRLQRYPAPVVHAGARLLKGIPRPLLDLTVGNGLKIFGRRAYRNAGERIHDRADALLQPSLQLAYQHMISYWRDTSIVNGGHNPSYVLNDPDRAMVKGSVLQQMQYLDTLCYLPDDILVKVDRAAMANSLETRVPMLSKNVIELAARIPTAMNLLHQDGKWPLRRILSRHVPAQLTERPKQGFAVPIKEWLRGPLREWGEDLLYPSRLSSEGYLDVHKVRQQWNRHTQQNEDCSFKLWGILMFEAWLQAWQKR